MSQVSQRIATAHAYYKFHWKNDWPSDAQKGICILEYLQQGNVDNWVI